jgi:hypothetical protein
MPCTAGPDERFTCQREIGDGLRQRGARRRIGAGQRRTARVVPLAVRQRLNDIRECDLLGLQRAAHGLRVVLEHLGNGAIGVHLIQQVEAAAQVQAERHGFQAHLGEERRRAGGERQRGDVALREGLVLVDGIARTQLVRHVREADHQPPLLERALREGDLPLVEEFLDGRLGRGVDLGAILTRELQCRRLAEHVRQR